MFTNTDLGLLEDAYQSVRMGKFQTVLEDLETLKFKRLVTFLTNVGNLDQSFWDESHNVRALELAVLITQEIYNNAADIDSPITDEEFDLLYAVYENVTSSVIVGASVGQGSKRVVSAHAYPNLRGTLSKIHFIENNEKKPGEARRSLEDWLKSLNTTFRPLVSDYSGTLNDTNETGYIVTPKLDGISAVFECDASGNAYRVLKRGDTERNEAEEMTDLFCPQTSFEKSFFLFEHKQKNLPAQPFGLKAEIIMRANEFKRFKEKFPDARSPRSAVSSIVNSLDIDKTMLEYLTIVPLRVRYADGREFVLLEDLDLAIGLDVMAIGYDIYNLEQVKSTVKRVQRDMSLLENPFDIDGVVITLSSNTIQQALGRENNINKFEVALKLPGERAETVLERVEFSVGDLGGITPVAVVKPVKLKGNTITNISLGSIARFNKLQLSPGDKVTILYDVIPYLEIEPENVTKRDVIQAPIVCPTCGELLVEKPLLMCDNSKCSSRIVGTIVNYVTKMDIPNIGEGTIRTLVEAGLLHSIADLYTLKNKARSIVTLPGFDTRSFERICEGIESRAVVPAEIFLGSLGIKSIGRRQWRKVLSHFTYNYVLTEAIEDPTKFTKELEKLPGIQYATAVRILSGVLLNYDLITALVPDHVKVLVTDPVEVNKDAPHIVFTKVRDKMFEAYLESRGAVVQSTVNARTTFLVVSSLDDMSSKRQKADKLGVAVVTLEEARKIFNYNA